MGQVNRLEEKDVWQLFQLEYELTLEQHEKHIID